MKFLIDQNLPPQLAVWLRASGHEANHVRDVLSTRALDAEMWEAALRDRAVVVTKDADYVALAELDHNGRVVLVRCGNLKLDVFRRWFAARLDPLIALLDLGERVVELR